MPPPSLDVVVVEITTANNYSQLSHTLRTFAPSEVRDAILSGPLTNGQDPLTVLDISQHTVGVLYILCARYSPSPCPMPSVLTTYTPQISEVSNKE